MTIRTTLNPNRRRVILAGAATAPDRPAVELPRAILSLFGQTPPSRGKN